MSFSDYYDRLMCECDYAARADYLMRLFDRFGHRPRCMLDLCCGTGSMTVELARRGVDMIGVDLSPDMLLLAQKKAESEGLDILLLCQSADRLDLYGTVDCCICTLDSLNHITEPSQLAQAFKRIWLFMESGGYFIFDVNTQYKHSEILGDNTFFIDGDDLCCVWQNGCDGPIVDIQLDIFELDDDGRYIRTTEYITERAYSDSELTDMLDAAGFEVKAIFGDMTELAPTDDAERKIFVARCVK